MDYTSGWSCKPIRSQSLKKCLQIELLSIEKCLLKRTHSKTIILDCCYSGTAIPEYGYDSGIEETTMNRISNAWSSFFSPDKTSKYPNLHLLTACSADQLAYESQVNQEHHGKMTRAILEELGWVHDSTKIQTYAIDNISVQVRGYHNTKGYQPIRTKRTITLSDLYASSKYINTPKQTLLMTTGSLEPILLSW